MSASLWSSLQWLGAIVPVVLLASAGILMDYRDWNRGVSRKSGRPWKAFDRDSNGGRGYTDGAGNYIWLSWIQPKQ